MFIEVVNKLELLESFRRKCWGRQTCMLNMLMWKTSRHFALIVFITYHKCHGWKLEKIANIIQFSQLRDYANCRWQKSNSEDGNLYSTRVVWEIRNLIAAVKWDRDLCDVGQTAIFLLLTREHSTWSASSCLTIRSPLTMKTSRPVYRIKISSWNWYFSSIVITYYWLPSANIPLHYFDLLQ